ncbi:helix-turn-helix domain-containing protein [Acuticoccus kalidii]|uniref:helix-turn-helix domain-containing protein n=1 Tax=Acuticoccus kalidii TaxID=2910977 RepID=UPI0034E1FAA3
MQAADKLRMWRKREGVSQASLASRLGCDQSMVSLYERGGRPSFRRMLAIRELTRGCVDLNDWVDHGDPKVVLEELTEFPPVGARS